MALSPRGRCPGFSASGSAQRPIPQLQRKAEIARLLSQGLWARRQKLEQQLNEMRSFDASVPPTPRQALEAWLTGGALVGLGAEAAGQKWVVSTS